MLPRAGVICSAPVADEMPSHVIVCRCGLERCCARMPLRGDRLSNRSGGVAIFHRIGTPCGKTVFRRNTLTDTQNCQIYTFLGFISKAL